MNSKDFDWKTYYEKGKASLTKQLEEDSEMWDRWTKSDKRYMLVCSLAILENTIDKVVGCVTGHLDCHISSDNADDLRLLWGSKFIQQRYNSTHQHFIADIQEKKIVEFVSVCM